MQVNVFGKTKTMNSRLRLNDDRADITLWCESKSIRAHKRILMDTTMFFYNLCTNLPPEQAHPFIVFADLRYDDLLIAINYLYGKKTEFDQNRLESITKTIETLQLRNVDEVDSGGMRPRETKEVVMEIAKGKMIHAMFAAIC